LVVLAVIIRADRKGLSSIFVSNSPTIEQGGDGPDETYSGGI
jgi:hypothetical protein